MLRTLRSDNGSTFSDFAFGYKWRVIRKVNSTTPIRHPWHTEVISFLLGRSKSASIIIAHLHHSLSIDPLQRSLSKMPATMLMPKIVYGTAWKKERTADLVVKAVLAGFRGVDTACQPKHYQSVRKGSKRPWFLSHGAETLPSLQGRTRWSSSHGTFIQAFYISILAMGSDEIYDAGRARHVKAITL